MHHTSLIQPTYTESFQCIGSACEDTCCIGWTVPVDQAATERFQTLPASPLRTLIHANVLLTPDGGHSQKPATFATIRMTASHQCPMLSEERLCRIQAERGETFLPHACATYPRIVHMIGGIEEKALTLSCPEAARLVLLNPALLNSSHATITEPFYNYPSGGDSAEDARSLQPWFWSIREFVLALVRNRAYPIWQRMFLLGIFCRRLDAIAKGELQCPIPAYLRDFEAAVASGAFRAAMDKLPVDRVAQLDVVLRFAGMLLQSSKVHPRFFDCIQAFTAGIGNGPGATFESIAARYSLAYNRFYAPFFDRHPYILENYLINAIFRCQFPFGRGGMLPGALPSMAREHALLTAQFALIKGLLIGVAGFHGEAFSADHVVHTVQGASKHFEHHQQFLNQAYTLLVESRMEDDRGVVILLRNTEPVHSSLTTDEPSRLLQRETAGNALPR